MKLLKATYFVPVIAGLDTYLFLAHSGDIDAVDVLEVPEGASEFYLAMPRSMLGIGVVGIGAGVIGTAPAGVAVTFEPLRAVGEMEPFVGRLRFQNDSGDPQSVGIWAQVIPGAELLPL